MISPTPFSLCFALLLCLPPLAFLFTTTNINPTTFIITPKLKILITTTSTPPPPPLEDLTLFKLASQTKPNPFHTKIAFMFLTTTPLPFSPLWERFFNAASPNLYNIYIHADPNTSTYTNPPFSGVFTDRLIPSKPTKRHTPTLISAARRLLAHALLHDSANSMFALLSPTCIPLHSFNFTYTTLINSTKSFIEILNNEPGAYDRWNARGPDVMLPEIPLSDFRVGSQFFVLTRRHARLVLQDDVLWEKFNLPCLRDDVCYPEEHYFSTLINLRDPEGAVPATLTHVDWNGCSDGHPRMYQASDVGAKMIFSFRTDRPRYGDEDGINGSDSAVGRRRRHDPYLFARKFDQTCLQPLMEIADEVIFQD